MVACCWVVEPSRLAPSSQVASCTYGTFSETPAHSSAGSRPCRSDGAGGSGFGRDEPNLERP